jgi:hypothetical protein
MVILDWLLPGDERSAAGSSLPTHLPIEGLRNVLLHHTRDILR